MKDNYINSYPLRNYRGMVTQEVAPSYDQQLRRVSNSACYGFNMKNDIMKLLFSSQEESKNQVVPLQSQPERKISKVKSDFTVVNFTTNENNKIVRVKKTKPKRGRKRSVPCINMVKSQDNKSIDSVNAVYKLMNDIRVGEIKAKYTFHNGDTPKRRVMRSKSMIAASVMDEDSYNSSSTGLTSLLGNINPLVRKKSLPQTLPSTNYGVLSNPTKRRRIQRQHSAPTHFPNSSFNSNIFPSESDYIRSNFMQSNIFSDNAAFHPTSPIESPLNLECIQNELSQTVISKQKTKDDFSFNNAVSVGCVNNINNKQTIDLFDQITIDKVDWNFGV